MPDDPGRSGPAWSKRLRKNDFYVPRHPRGYQDPATRSRTRLERDERVREVVRRADVEEVAEKRGGLAEAAHSRRVPG